jgi:predicted nuclease of predicted toxin-antitoxin system
MTRTELDKLLSKLKIEKGLRFDYGESLEGVQYIRFEVDDDGDKLLSEATDEEIIAFADDEGYTLTVKDCQLWFVFYYTYEFLNYLRWRSEELSENVLDLTAERHTNKMMEELYPGYKLAEEMAKDFEESEVK